MDAKEALERLELAFHKWLESENFSEFERLLRNFHNYSLNNLLLILSQKPNATRIAGFNTWKKMERNVKKGEKGIMIIAPNTKKIVTGSDSDEEEVIFKVTGFRPVYVFDISQTEGKDLVEELLDMEIKDEYEGLGEIITKIENMGYKVEWYDESIQGEHGFVVKPNNIIHVLSNQASGQKASTILHEWTHLQCSNMDVETEEVIAQSVSYFIMARMGLDTSWYTAKYLQRWANTKKWEDIAKLLSTADKLSKQFFNSTKNKKEE